MKFIKPKNNNATNVDWLISERVRAIVKTYAEFTEYSESEVVDIFLLNILDDKDFLNWIEGRRNNKRIIKQLQIEDSVESEMFLKKGRAQFINS
ncbi:hypothetical protein [Neobacillus terrae]|uniref:hypothetical protein n=1 Tax=Neobacillus terrae TaxID=3034837 RepID=UPI00140D9FBB|nr:hypothetical protein [Neobacillus terrae]NHM31983.1 hypothetical protein [Neobacillus terrae]